MKITKRQLRRIIREEKSRLDEFGIDRMTSGDNDPRLDDPDDLTLSIELWEKIVEHLQAINDIFDSDAGRQLIVTSGDHALQKGSIQDALPWAEEWLRYMKEDY